MNKLHVQEEPCNQQSFTTNGWFYWHAWQKNQRHGL